MRFLFVNPNRSIAEDNIWGVIDSVMPPLGLATLSAVLESSSQGHSSEIVDAYAENLGIPDILSRVTPDTDVIGITATTPEIGSAIEIARAVRDRFPDKRILMGGVHPTIFHESLVADGICDMVVRGEGERAVLQIAERAPLPEIPHLTWRSAEGRTIINPQGDEFVPLDDLPMPSYHKLPMKKYRSAIGAAIRTPSIGMMTSRGCPGQCTFCYSGMFGKTIRFLSAEKICDQMLYLKSRYGIREISFYDDTFTANPKRVEQLCDLLVSRRADIAWSCFARVDTVNAGILGRMKAAGCHQIMYGFESIDESILKAVNKKVDATRYAAVVAWTRAAGIDIRGAFMLGSPEETEASLKATLEYSRKIDIQYAIFNITTPYPGTTLFDWASEKGYLRHTRWTEYDLSHAVLDLPTIAPETVEAYYRKAYRRFYLRGSYIWAHLLSIKTVENFLIHLAAAIRIAANSLRRK